MRIRKGRYNLENRNLSFDLAADLDSKNDGSCFYFRGGNGFGKTSFLEKLVIPALQSDNLPYLYIGQDIRTQLYTLKALLSVRGYKVSDTDDQGLLRLWVTNSRSAGVFILDEFDKYFPDYGFIFDWSNAFIQTYIIVTHQGYHPSNTAGKRYRIRNIRFELLNFEGRLKNISVKEE